MLDRRKTKVDFTTEVFGKPNVLIRNNPNFLSQDLRTASEERGAPNPNDQSQMRASTVNTQRDQNGDTARAQEQMKGDTTNRFNRSVFSE